MKKTGILGATFLTLGLVAGPAQAMSLSGTVFDKVPSSALSGIDFQNCSTFGVRTGMVNATLSGAAPTFVGAANDCVDSAGSFGTWFTDTNGKERITLTLAPVVGSPGLFRFEDTDFFPINGQLAGNYSNTGRNYHFTMKLNGQTSFRVGDTFSFTGDDDLWVFINNKLVMDLGGVHSPETRTITVNNAWLTTNGFAVDTPYAIDIFFAERHTTQSNFSITTSFRVSEVPEPATLALLSVGLLGVGAATRRRRR